jgi:hypothetical protein
MSQDKPIFTDHTLVNGDLIEGTIVRKKTFQFNKLLGKHLSIGYSGGFDKEKLGQLIQELKSVHDKMEDEIVDCPECGGGGFSSPGTGYNNVCDTCGGQGKIPFWMT